MTYGPPDMDEAGRLAIEGRAPWRRLGEYHRESLERGEIRTRATAARLPVDGQGTPDTPSEDDMMPPPFMRRGW